VRALSLLRLGWVLVLVLVVRKSHALWLCVAKDSLDWLAGESFVISTQ
jgi:hypothetical protein